MAINVVFACVESTEGWETLTKGIMSEGAELLKHPVLLPEVLGHLSLGDTRMVTFLLTSLPQNSPGL